MRHLSKISRIKVFLKDPNKKPFLKIIKEFIVLAFIKKEIPFYYFKFLYKKKITNYLDYVGLKEQQLITTHHTLNNPQYIGLLDDKLFFAFFSEKINLETPKVISYNFGSTFFFNNTTEHINTRTELIKLFEKIFDQSAIDSLFFRPPSEEGGRGCFKISRDEITQAVNSNFEMFMKDSYVHTEVINQHKQINNINSNSINTLRIVTLVTSDHTTQIVSALMRFGVGNSVVDNASSGGFFVGINMEKGTLKDFGYYLQEHSGNEIYEHPDSGVKFKDFKVPFFKEACEMATNAVKVIPVRLIGWDVAITPTGPIIIESNAHIHIPVSDMAYGGLLQNEHIRKVFDELKSNAS
tara:strand:- start:384 stop:1439 length:1056 start_codon:yes stop_codon:yes gene_type:complete